MKDRVFIDGHSHWHDALDPVAFLDSARRNFRLAGGLAGTSLSLQGVLCLADFPGAEGWARLQTLLRQPSVDLWRLSAPDEMTIMARHVDGDRLWLVAGRQIITSEKIEVMALGIVRPVSSGMSLQETVQTVNSLSGLPVLPWGAGKWWGYRGRLVQKALLEKSPLLLGDNGGRPGFWRPLLLDRARGLGIGVLPGSDPLPVAGDCRRNGAYNLSLAGVVPEKDPSQWLKKLLAEPSSEFEYIGGTLGFISFVSNQLALRR